jgi:hypothetical protein
MQRRCVLSANCNVGPGESQSVSSIASKTDPIWLASHLQYAGDCKTAPNTVVLCNKHRQVAFRSFKISQVCVILCVDVVSFLLARVHRGQAVYQWSFLLNLLVHLPRSQHSCRCHCHRLYPLQLSVRCHLRIALVLVNLPTWWSISRTLYRHCRLLSLRIKLQRYYHFVYLEMELISFVLGTNGC